MTESEKKQIKELWQGGMPITQIRQTLAVDARTFNATIRKMKANGDFDEPRKRTQDKIIEAYQSGIHNPYALAEMYGVSRNYVNLVFHWHGIKRQRNAQNWKHCERTTAIVEDLKEGVLTHAEIAKKHGTSSQWVNQIKQRMERNNEPNRNV